MAALALRDEQLPLTGTHISETEAQHLAATQTTQQHGSTIARSRSVRSAPTNASTSEGSSTRGSVRGVRINGSARRRYRPLRAPSPLGTRLRSTIPRTNRYSNRPDTLDSRRRSVRADSPRSRLRDAAPAHPSRAALGGQEPHHIGHRDLGQLRAHHSEKDLQVIRGRQPAVRPQPGPDERQVLVERGFRAMTPTVVLRCRYSNSADLLCQLRQLIDSASQA